MGLLSRQERERYRKRPSGALSQADDPGQLVFKADCNCPKTKSSVTAIANPAGSTTGAKGTC